jgi:hypothetical protein
MTVCMCLTIADEQRATSGGLMIAEGTTVFWDIHDLLLLS